MVIKKPMKKNTRFSLLFFLTIGAGAALTTSVCFFLGLFDEQNSGDIILPAETTADGGPAAVEADINGPLASVPVGEGTNNGTAAAPPRGEIRARILDSRSGEPLSFYTAWVFKSGEGDLDKLTRGNTGKLFHTGTGILGFEKLERGSYTLFVRSGGYKDLVVRNIAVPQKKSLLEFTMGMGTHIRGRIEDSNGKPKTKMLVVLLCTPFAPGASPPPRNTTITDSLGRYLFGDLVAGEYEIRLQSFSNPLASAERIFLAEGGALVKDFTVPTFCTLTFQVSDKFSNLLPNVAIRLHSDEGESFRAKTKPGGKVSIEYVPPGTYRLTISKRGFKLHVETVTVFVLTGKLHFERVLKFDI
jgi:hypothetical protein